MLIMMRWMIPLSESHQYALQRGGHRLVEPKNGYCCDHHCPHNCEHEDSLRYAPTTTVAGYLRQRQQPLLL